MRWPRFSRWNIEQAALPWGDRPSILAFLESEVGRAGRADGEVPSLPDEEQVTGVGGLRWAAGARDGVGLYHMGPGTSENAADAAWSSIRAVLRDASDTNLNRLYEAVMSSPAMQVADSILEKASQAKALDQRRTLRLARWLTREGADREVVKLGIVLLGLSGDATDRPSLELLARHDEFTLFAVVALTNANLSSPLDLWAIAREVRGWGRVHVVPRLVKCEDPRVRRWLLREGFRTSALDEYLALACAEGGDLAGELAEEHADSELLDGAASMLAAIAATTQGGPSRGFEAYPAGVDAVRGFLRHAVRKAGSLEQLIGAGGLLRFVESTKVEWGGLAPLGWTEAVRVELAAAARRVVELPEWPNRVREGIASEVFRRFFEASAAADELGLDVWEDQFSRLRSARNESDACWWHVCRTTDVERMDRVLAYAEKVLPLDRIGSGPASEKGFGDEFRSHRDLDWTLQELRRFPGRGWPLLRAGLRSPVVRNRVMSLTALAAWPRASWPGDAQELVETALREEPEPRTREDLERLLRGEPPI